MLEKLRQFFQTKAGAATAGVLLILSLIVAFFMLRGAFTTEAAAISSSRIYVDEKGNSFRVTIKSGEPVKAPGGGAAFPAELCYWTKDGKPKDTPTAVLLNGHVGKPEPTFCPDCGRLVVPHNPPPSVRKTPPPTQAEYKPGRGRSN